MIDHADLADELPPAPEDDWGRGLDHRGSGDRLLWVRPGHRIEHHDRIERVGAGEALVELDRWLADDAARSFLESLHDRAYTRSFAEDPDGRWAAATERLREAFARGDLVLHADRLEHATPGMRPSPAEPARPPGARPPHVVPAVVANLIVQVRTPDGSPLAGATVRIAGPSSDSSTSDGGGVARFERIPPGRYSVEGERRGFVEGSTSATATAGSTTTVTVVLTPIELEIVDERGEVVTGERVWIVGERVVLTARTRPPDRAIESIRWIVPGRIVGGQEYSKARGTILPVPVSAWTGTSMTFHWVEAHAASRVIAKAAVEGASREASARVRVEGPTGVTFTSTTSAVTLGPNLEGDYALKFHVSPPPGAHPDDPGTPGIKWEVSYRTPPGVTGRTAWLQLIQPRRSHTSESGRVGLADSGGAFWLDDSGDPSHPFYQMPLPISAPGLQTNEESDSPSNPIEKRDVASQAADVFRLYAMYNPGTSGAIWVTVAKLAWSWSGHAALVDGLWRIVTSDHLRHPDGAPSSELPEWAASFQSRRVKDWSTW